jgi:outer membrane autotransporter protein
MTVILSDGSRRETGFKFAVPYVGLYAGAGYVWPVTQETSLEWYGKYFWTWMEGKSTSLRTGERVSFDAMDSHRLRAGLRFSHMLTETLSAYAGVAYEHEFDAKVRAGAYSYGLTGGTGFGEIGLRVNPTPSQPLSIDFGVQGYAGKREGVTASVKVEYRF